MSEDIYNNPLEDQEDINDAFPEKVDEEAEYVEAAPGHYIETGLGETKYTVQAGRLEGTQRTFRRLHCCSHIVRPSNAVGVCAVGHKTVCARPDCSAWCKLCRNLVCRRHYVLDERYGGVPICDNCLAKINRPVDIRIFFAIAIMVIILAVYFLLK